MALSADKDVVRKEGGLQSYPVEDDVTIYKGALVCINSSGYLVPGADAASYRFVGVAYEKVDNTLSGHSQGGKSCRVYTSGAHKLTATSITQAMVGQMMYLTDDATIDDTTGGTYYIPVGRLVEYVDTDEGWVDIGQRHLVGGADNVLLAPNATKMLEVHTWGIVMASGSLYLAADYGAYITASTVSGRMDLAADSITFKCGAAMRLTVTETGFRSAYEFLCTGVINVKDGVLDLPQMTDAESGDQDEGEIWYNTDNHKLEFQTNVGVETITSA